jgi:hypothetical protein
MFNPTKVLSGLMVAGIIGGGSATANRSIGPPVYSPPSSQSGYMVQDTVGFRAYRIALKVPDAPTDGQAGLVGVDLTDLSAGRQAACGWLGIGSASGVIGCFDEADPHTGWVTLLPTISTGDSIVIHLNYNQTGEMVARASDISSGTSWAYTFSGPTGEVWSEVLIGADPSTNPTVARETIGAFSGVGLAPIGGRETSLTGGPWTVQPVIDTTNGQSSGQVVAYPTAIGRYNSFSVTQTLTV